MLLFIYFGCVFADPDSQIDRARQLLLIWKIETKITSWANGLAFGSVSTQTFIHVFSLIHREK